MDDLIGKKVVVFSDSANGERQDIGTLEASDQLWLRLRKAGNEMMYFCLYNVRLVKPFDS